MSCSECTIGSCRQGGKSGGVGLAVVASDCVDWEEDEESHESTRHPSSSSQGEFLLLALAIARSFTPKTPDHESPTYFLNLNY